MRRYSGWKLWFWWVAATSVVGTVGLVVPDILVLGLPAYSFRGDNGIYPLGMWLSGLLLVVAPSVGTAQAVVVRHFTGLSILQEWVVTTILGVLSAILVDVFVNVVVCMSGGLLLPGTVIGFSQWIVLRRYVERVGWWILACTIGWNAGLLSGWAVGTNLLPAGWFLFPYYPLQSAAHWIVVWLVGMVVFSAITGLALASLLLRHGSVRSVVMHTDQPD